MSNAASGRRKHSARLSASLVAVLLSATGISLGYLVYYYLDPRRPTSPSLGSGWWTFSDQGRYLLAAQAWAAGSLDPSSHWYLPGYPLLAAPFLHLTHSNPFLIPNLIMLAIGVVLISAIAAKLAPGWRLARAAGAIAAAASLSTPLVLDSWVTPWTTTPVTVLMLGALLGSIAFASRPTRWQPAFWSGICTGAMAGVRPADAMLTLCAVSLSLCIVAGRGRIGLGSMARATFALAAGTAIASTPFLGAYVLVNGLHLNSYLLLSSIIGFEWRLLPLRWVTIVLSPRTVFPDGHGLVSAFPWIVSGITGMVACILAPPGGGRRIVHLLLVGMTAGQFVLYLSYRDFHPTGLWLNYNYHYFKFVLLVCALYSVLLVGVVFERKWYACAAGIAGLAMVLPWRVELRREHVLSPTFSTTDRHVVHLPNVTLGIQDALLIPAQGSFDAMYNRQHNLYVGASEEKWYSSTGDFKAFKVPSGLMITPLRPFQSGPITVRFDASIDLLPGATTVARQEIMFGFPCWWPVGRCGTQVSAD